MVKQAKDVSAYFVGVPLPPSAHSPDGVLEPPVCAEDEGNRSYVEALGTRFIKTVPPVLLPVVCSHSSVLTA
jgi:hypothetical protein